MHGRLNKNNRVMSQKSDEITMLVWAMDAESEKLSDFFIDFIPFL